MPGVTCPKCGTENKTGRFSCAKCYAPLASPVEKAKANEARAQRRRERRAPGVPLLPTREALASVSPYEVFAALVGVTFLLFVFDRDLAALNWVYLGAAALSALGLAGVVRHGSLDLSLGAVMGLGALVGVVVADYGAGPALLAAVLIGAAVGAVNAALVRLRGLPPALATLCTAAVIGGLVLSYVPDTKLIEELGGYSALATGKLAGIPVAVVLVLAVLLIDQYLLRRLEALKAPDGPVVATPQVAASHVLAGSHAALAGALLASAHIRPAQLMQSAWHLLPFAALCLGGAVFVQRRAPLLAALSGAALVGLPACRVEHGGLPVLTFLVAGVALIAGSVLDLWKERGWSALFGRLREDARVATGSLSCSLLVVGAGWGVFDDALHRVPPRSAMVLKVVGEVSFLDVESTTWAEATPRALLTAGDRLKTGPEAAALVATSRGATVKVDPQTELTFDTIDTMQEDTPNTRLRLATGRVWTLVKRSANEKTNFSVETPSVVAAVRGTAFSFAAANRRHYVSCADGIVTVKAQRESVLLKPGEETEVARDRPPARPRPMSPAERNGWLRERPLLEHPREGTLWDSGRQRTGYLADDFAGDSLDSVIWRMRVEPDGPDVGQEAGHLYVQGDISSGLSPDYSHGIVSQSFSHRACEAVVNIQIREGDGTAVLRLSDERGSHEGVAVVVHPTEGTRLIGPDGAQGHLVDTAKGYQTSYSHVVLRYEPALRVATAFSEGNFLGSVNVELGESLHYELVAEGRRRGGRKLVELWFDNFSTNVGIPPEQALRMTVAALGDADTAEHQSSLLLLQPLLEPDALKAASVTYPYKLLSQRTRIFAPRKQTENMRFDRRLGAWALQREAQHPAEGDYIFQFVVRESGHKATKWMHLREPLQREGVPPLQEQLTDADLQVRWQLPPETAADWVDLIGPKPEQALQMMDQPLSPNALSIPRRDFSNWRWAMPVVYARVGAKANDSQVEEWAEACAVLRPFLRPGMQGRVEMSSPHGSEQFLLRCGKHWES